MRKKLKFMIDSIQNERKYRENIRCSIELKILFTMNNVPVTVSIVLNNSNKTISMMIFSFCSIDHVTFWFVQRFFNGNHTIIIELSGPFVSWQRKIFTFVSWTVMMMMMMFTNEKMPYQQQKIIKINIRNKMSDEVGWR